MTPLLSAHGIKRDLGPRLTLDVANVAVDRGEVLAVFGPSGAGKTTLVKILGLIEDPDAGTVMLDGAPASRRDVAKRRRIATVMQSPTLWRGTVADNVGYGLRLRSVPLRERSALITASLATAGFRGATDIDASTLSGGEAQRVALARALALKPEVLILDEPLSHVDEPLREQLAIGLKRFIVDNGCAAVWVTHDRAEALSVSERLTLIQDGRLIQTGDTQEVFTKPASPEAARLVGADNVFPARILTSDDGLVTIQVEGSSLVLTATSPLPVGAQVFASLRPEDVLLFDHEPTEVAPRNRIMASVVEVVPFGATAKVLLDSSPISVALVTRPTIAEMAIVPGRQLWIAFKATAIHMIPRA